MPHRFSCPHCGRIIQVDRPSLPKPMSSPMTDEEMYRAEVSHLRRVIPERGHLWEGARPAYEAGEYRSKALDRLLKEKVIVPHPDAAKGYTLPELAASPQMPGRAGT